MSITQIVLIVLVLFASVAMGYRIGKRISRGIPPKPESDAVANSGESHVATIAGRSEAVKSKTENRELEFFTICNEAGAIIVQSNEIAGIPGYARRLPPDSPSVHQAAQLAADLFKGGISLPNRSINIVFRPDVQAGLQDGTYTLMKTTAGETLADAIDAGGKIVAKGRIVETGKLRQLASGAFQLASIVVAQSHLADIEHSLNELRKDVGILGDDLEASNLSDITGKSSYILSLIDHIKQAKVASGLPAHFANSIQHIVLEAHKLRDKVHEDIKSLIRRVEQQTDPDRFGTEGIYKALRAHVDKANSLLMRHEKLMQLVAVLNYAIIFMDPTGKQFSRVGIEEKRWNELCNALAVGVKNKAETFLSHARFNADDTLILRKKDIVRDTDDFLQKSNDQRTAFERAMQSLTENNDRYFGKNAETHIALSFDDHGSVKEAAVL